MMLKTFMRAAIYYSLFASYSFIYTLLFSCSILVDHLKSIITKKKYHPALKLITKKLYATACLCICQLSGLKIYLKGDKITNERTLWICNHRSTLDFLIVQIITICHGNLNVIISAIINKIIPVINIISFLNGTIYVKKGREKDIDNLKKGASKSKEEAYSIILFPEGFIMGEKRLAECHKFCLEKNIKQTFNVMIPRRTGFDILQKFGNFNNIGNLTIRYENPPLNTPKLHDYETLFIHFPTEVYVENHYEKITGDDLYEVFTRKEQSLNDPVDQSEYTRLIVPKLKIVAHLSYLFLFYYCLYIFPYFSLSCLGFTLLSPLIYFF